MNHCVPDFQLDGDGSYSIPAIPGFAHQKKSQLADEQVMELLWQNGQVVMQSQNQRSVRRSNTGDAVTPADQPAAREIRPDEDAATQIFIQEDEMNSWLHYPIDDASFCRDFYSDLVCSTPADVPPQSAEEVKTVPPPPPPSRPTEPRFQSFGHFSIPKGKAKESTVIESSGPPVAAPAPPESRASHITGNIGAPSGAFFRNGSMSCTVGVTSSVAGGDKETGTYDLTVTSSPGGSGASISASAEPVHMPPPPLPAAAEAGRKRKGRGGGDENDYQSEDVDYESLGPKKKGRGSTSTKRSRAAEVHNLSERRRRDRINEKMKALHELIPRCNKSDKASMLDEAIEYLKSLQLQVQMMSMGCSMVPMMFPGVQQYMPAMRMGMGMGMGMGMDMGANRPMMPFQSVMPGSGFSAPAAAAAPHLGPRFPMQPFNMRPVPMSDPSRVQATTSQPDPMMNSFGIQNPNQTRMPNFADPYQQYLGLQQAQVPLPQNQVMMMPPSSCGPSDNKEIRTDEKL